MPRRSSRDNAGAGVTDNKAEATDGPQLPTYSQLVLDILRARPAHFSTLDLFKQARERHSRVGFATVYRTVNNLVADGLVREVHVGGGAAFYEGTTRDHGHAVCHRCGHIADLDLTLPAGTRETVNAATGFVVSAHELTFFGLCSSCQGASGGAGGMP